MQSHTELSVLILSEEPGETRVLLAILRAMQISDITVARCDAPPVHGHFHLALIAAGDESGAALRAADGVRQRTQQPGPYIAVVSLHETAELLRCIEWGRIDGVLRKPITIAALTDYLENAIERVFRS